MISPTEPKRCRDEQRNAPEWWARCEEQGRRLRKHPSPFLMFALTTNLTNQRSQSASQGRGARDMNQCRRQ